MDLLQLIKERRSVRKFKKDSVSDSDINDILEAGRWAPSGLNNQPWQFMVLGEEQKDSLAGYTHYSHIVKDCNKTILIFLNKETSYNCEKDLLAIGACIQNILLVIHSKGLGACWLGEILNKRKEIYKLLKTPRNLELEAVIALGKPAQISKSGKRKPLKNLMVYR
ncbi:MAG: nitroreductase family protein [Candidatus Omnitrophota bacterium]